MLEQATSPAGGFWQTRQASVHSRQAGSGGTKMLAAGGAGTGGAGAVGTPVGEGAPGAGAAGSMSTASTIAGQSTIAAASHRGISRIMAASLPITFAQVEPA